jgi:hypothetical protein
MIRLAFFAAACSRPWAVVVPLLAVTLLADPLRPVHAQVPQPPAPAQKSNEVGVLDAITRWLDESAAKARDVLGLGEDERGAIRSNSGVAPGGTNLMTGDVVRGRERCQAAPNGAPDCRTAAAAICQRKGFQAGRSVEIESAERCPAQVWLSGRMAREGECPVESFVTTALCR